MGDFQVRRITRKQDFSVDDYDERTGEELPEPLYFVFLPHQCDTWDIAGDFSYQSGDEGEAKADAIEALEQFLADGQAALERLRADEEYGDCDR